MKDKKLYLESLFATALVFIIMALFAYFPFNVKVFNPIKESLKDFKLTDLYYSKLTKEKGKFEEEVVLINIGNSNREEIAGMLMTINGYEPSVIGADIIFKDLKGNQGDTLLHEAISQVNDKLVMINQLPNSHEGEEEVQRSHPYFTAGLEGYANFVGEKPYASTIRYFRPTTTIKDEKLPSFALQIVKKHNPSAAENLLNRGKYTEKINYTGNYQSFAYFDSDEIFPGNDDLKLLKDKIVLLGYMGPEIGHKVLEDFYFTPLNAEFTGRSIPDMYGMVIHANIISMTLNGNYINKMSKWFAIILAFVVCYLHVIFFMYFFVNKHLWYHLFAKLIQLFTSIIMMYIVFQFYSKGHYEINSTITITAILLSVDVLYVYESIVAFVYKKKGTKSYFIHSH